MNPGRQINLGVYAVGTGNHVSGWRFPGAATSSEDFSIFKTIANSCERGKLDFLFVGDSLAFIPEQHPGQMLQIRAAHPARCAGHADIKSRARRHSLDHVFGAVQHRPDICVTR